MSEALPGLIGDEAGITESQLRSGTQKEYSRLLGGILTKSLVSEMGITNWFHWTYLLFLLSTLSIAIRSQREQRGRRGGKWTPSPYCR
jgi:hypothetical protein